MTAVPAVEAAYGVAPVWRLSDSPYLKASIKVGPFCDKAVPALVPPSLVDQCGPPVVCSGQPAGRPWSTPRTRCRVW